MRWDVAHRVASIAAVHAHRDYAIDRSGYVDVFAAITAAGIVCMAQPMPRLLGFYVAQEDAGPGILVNSGQDEIGMRHGGGHELGHFVLQHSSCLDEDPFERWGNGTWPDEEKTAEAFAAWFLMPPPAVRAALNVIGIEAPREPADVYQLARWLGTSYAGTVRHLVNMHMLRPEQANTWSKVPPATLRRRAQGPADDPHGHVWIMGPSAHGATAHVAAGDRIHLLLPACSGQIERPAGITYLQRPETHARGKSAARPGVETGPLLQVTGALTSPTDLIIHPGGGCQPWQVTLALAPLRRGLSEAWRCHPGDDHPGA